MDKAIDWVRRVLGNSVVHHEALVGATSSEVHRILIDGGPNVVLRLFTNAEWLAMEPDLAEHEATALEVAAGLEVPTPELLAVDPTGSEAGTPALLMSELPGLVVLRPPDKEPWLTGLAEAMAILHNFEVPGFPWKYRVWQNLDRLTVPYWSGRPALWEEVIDQVGPGAPPFSARFIHRDFHPTNVLWSEGRVSGIVDWVNACWGPPGVDLAHCRLNLTAMYGLEVAEDFAARYRALTNRSPDPIWDLIALIEWLPEGDVYPPWLDLGLTDLDTATVRTRLEDFARAALNRLG